MLAKAGLSHKTRLLTELMVLNRLIEPASELAMSEWVRRSALCDILKTDFSLSMKTGFTATWTSFIPSERR